MARLLTLLADTWPADSPLGRAVSAYEGDIGPSGHSLPLRIAGGLHALVLNAQALDLKSVYPPHAPSDKAFAIAILQALSDHQAFLVDWIKSPPQTNEVRRSAVFIAGAQVAISKFALPIQLSELGASGGLNLMWDHYALQAGDHRYGAQLPVLTLRPEWDGPLPPAAKPKIVTRAGVDLNPLDPQRHDHLLRMTAYLWADQPDRISMARAAASVMNVTIDKGDAIDWLAERLVRARQGHMHLIQHSVAWQYFPVATQKRGQAMIEAAGGRATRDRPLAWLSMESDGDDRGSVGAAITLRLWPGNLTLDLGRADFHGRWINWAYEA